MVGVNEHAILHGRSSMWLEAVMCPAARLGRLIPETVVFPQAQALAACGGALGAA
jgi:hypothetical protein